MQSKIEQILIRLKKSGYEAYMVGGCVRDLLLGKEPDDYDITTNALPDEIIEVFKGYKTLSLGKRYGTITVIFEDETFEITTYRTEQGYSDSRHPDKVMFSNRIEEDLTRRDLTINAMAMDKDIIDLHGGRDDLKNKIIRAVGNPDERFKEDALRMVRAIRFATVLDFQIEECTFNSILENSHLLKNVAPERLKPEMNKILLSDSPSRGLELLARTKALKYILEELYDCVGFEQRTKYHDKTVFEHIKCVVDSTEVNLKQRMAAMLHDVAKPKTFSLDENGQGHFYGHDEVGAEIAEKALRKFGYSKNFIKQVQTLIYEHMKVHEEMTDKALRRQIRRVGVENILDLYSLMLADRMCTIADRDMDFLLNRRDRIKQLLKEDTVKEKFLCLNGNDIKELGYSEGRQIGEILRYLEEIVLDKPQLNKKEYLIEILKNRGWNG